MLRSIRQQSLTRCRLELEDRPLGRASVFPVFDATGRTRAIMITAEENGRIMLVDWHPDLFARHWPRRNRLQVRFADLRDACASDAERLRDLWHFDPWWVLGEERYSGHGAVPVLRSTNIPGYDETIRHVWFDRTLGCVSYAATGSDESLRVRRFAASMLADPDRQRRVVRSQDVPIGPRVEWQLRPFWS